MCVAGRPGAPGEAPTEVGARNAGYFADLVRLFHSFLDPLAAWSCWMQRGIRENHRTPVGHIAPHRAMGRASRAAHAQTLGCECADPPPLCWMQWERAAELGPRITRALAVQWGRAPPGPAPQPAGFEFC